MNFLFPTFLFLITLEFLITTFLFRRLWKRSWINRFSFAIAAIPLTFLLLRRLSIEFNWIQLRGWVQRATSISLVFLLTYTISLLIVAGLFALEEVIRQTKRCAIFIRDKCAFKKNGTFQLPEVSATALERKLSRRQLISRVSFAIPGASLATAGLGVKNGLHLPQLRDMTLHFPSLDPRLDNFTIAQLTDLHLGTVLQLHDLENSLKLCREASPDLLVITGDFVEDTSLLAAALGLVDHYKPPYGAFAVLGNHEGYRGEFKAQLRGYAESPVPLLRNEGRLIRGQGKRAGASLYLAGIDDKFFLTNRRSTTVEPWIRKAVENAPPSVFRVLLSHRPESFSFAVDHDIDLVLSGHTHGGQVGFFGRSLFEWLRPSSFRWFWGEYETHRDGKSAKLYTSSGGGHWLPFRLGCPTEIPMIRLKSGRSK